VNHAVILAGGEGVRLQGLAGGLPKALVEVGGVPLLGRQLDLLAAQGFAEVTILGGNSATPEAQARFNKIVGYCEDDSRWGLQIQCLDEKEPLGTAGALVKLAANFNAPFFVLYADTVLDIDLARMWHAHNRTFAGATILVHPTDHLHDSDLVEVDENSMVTKFWPYPRQGDHFLPNLANAALYVVDPFSLTKVGRLPKFADFVKDVFPSMLDAAIPINAYNSPEYIKDAGTPERIAKVSYDLSTGRLEHRSMRQPCPAVFIDRDGVLNVDKGLIKSHYALDMIAGCGDALRRLNESRFWPICVTNQPVIARGEVDWPELRRIQGKLDGLLSANGAFLEAVYVCPHHPDKGFPGERPEYKMMCDCRKPATGLLDRAKRDFNVDMPASWMIGDQTSDIELARRAGLRSILVLTGLAGGDGRYQSKPDFVAQDFTEAVDIILETTGNGHHPFNVRARGVSSSSDQFLREDNDYQ
jgi:histidinol-phosphate phosphatase family protein